MDKAGHTYTNYQTKIKAAEKKRKIWNSGFFEDKEKTLPKNHPVIFELTNPRGDLIDKQVERINETGFYSFVTT